MYARKIISHTISKRNSTWLTKTCLINAYEERPHTYLNYRTPNKAEADYYHYLSQKEKVSIEQK